MKYQIMNVTFYCPQDTKIYDLNEIAGRIYHYDSLNRYHVMILSDSHYMLPEDKPRWVGNYPEGRDRKAFIADIDRYFKGRDKETL